MMNGQTAYAPLPDGISRFDFKPFVKILQLLISKKVLQFMEVLTFRIAQNFVWGRKPLSVKCLH